MNIPIFQIDIATEASSGLTVPAEAVVMTNVFDNPTAEFKYPVGLYYWASMADFNAGKDKIILVDPEDTTVKVVKVEITMNPNTSYNIKNLLQQELENIWGEGNVTYIPPAE